MVDPHLSILLDGIEDVVVFVRTVAQLNTWILNTWLRGGNLKQSVHKGPWDINSLWDCRWGG